MKHTQVKICGITNAEDAVWCVNLGADFIGVNFYSESPRKVSIDKAAEIVKAVPPFVKVVGVFVNPDAKTLEKTLNKVPLHILQLHGDETPEQLESFQLAFNKPIWKAVRMESAETAALLPSYQTFVEAILLDTYKPGEPGGTGEVFNWDWALAAKPSCPKLALSGGLNAENVAKAIKKVEPDIVDVASGVEKNGHPRRKDIEKLKSFILSAKK